MKYCSNCGRQLLDEAVICPGCGCPTGTYTQTQQNGQYQSQNNGWNNPQTAQTENLLRQISERYKINGIIWIVVASLQLIAGFLFNWVLCIIGGLNLFSAIADLNYSKTVITEPKNIVKKVKPLASPIISLVYNLVFGGVIGVAGSIYYLVALRSFILENENQLKQFDDDFQTNSI